MDQTTESGYDDRTIGRRLRRIRNARGKSIRVVAGLAGISIGHLSEIENGLTALDSRKVIVGLAYALQVAPSELTSLPIPAPGDGGTDAAIAEIRRAVLAVDHDSPGGQSRPLNELRARVATTLDGYRQIRNSEVGAALPALVRDLHTTIAAGRDVAELLDLAVLLHIQGTAAWLRTVGAPLDLRTQVATLARRAAQARDEPTALGIAAVGNVGVLLAAGAFDLAQVEVDTVTVPVDTPETMQLAGMLSLSGSLVAAADGRLGDANARLEQADELAERTGEANAYWMGFGPTNVGQWRMAGALEMGDAQQAVAIAETLRPDVHPNRTRRAAYWADYGRALARMRGRGDDAARALRRAERISPFHVYRHPFVRDTLAELHARHPKRDDAIGRELRGMAYRAGLPV